MILFFVVALVAFADVSATYSCSCPSIVAPMNGAYDLTSGNMSCGATVTFSCDTGYEMDGSATSHCTYVCPNGFQWSTPAPTCVGKCPTLDDPEHGYVYVNGEYIDDVASYCCASNYKLQGSRSRTCLLNLEWSGDAPTCRGVCQAPSAPLYGFVEVSDGLWVGSQATYSCAGHFILVGDEVRTCEDNFCWSGTEPTCQQVCTKPANPANGVVIAVPPIKVGQTISYKCNHGYALVGTEVRSCMAENRWNAPAPYCAEECSKPSAPTNGYVAVEQPIISGIKAMFSCKPGYMLDGSTISACCADGTWSKPFPKCVRVCALPSAPSNGMITPSTSPGIEVGGIVTYSCNAGYILVGSETRECVGGNVWKQPAPECLKACTPPAAPENGAVDTSGGLYQGAVAKFTCNENYRLSGKSTVYCLANDTWSCETPECIGVCTPPSAPAYGSVDTSQGLDVGSCATFSCNYGYELDGAETTTCQSGNQWSHPTPTCVEVCYNPPKPTNGEVDISDGLHVGSVAKYSCDDNYRLDGESESTCQKGKCWSNPPPKCIPVCPAPVPDENGSVVSEDDNYDVGSVAYYSCNDGYVVQGCTFNKTICMSSHYWSRTAPRCIEVCDKPANPTNGIVKINGVKVGSEAVFSCNDGYGLEGSMKATCNKGGEWSEEPPTCVEVCDPPMAPGYGTVSVSGLMIGDIAKYSCDMKYELVGDATRTCEIGGNWSGEKPKCVGIVKSCAPPAAPINGSVATPDGLEVGKCARYSCKSGFVLVGAKRRTCLKSLTWSDEVPLCVEVCTPPPSIANGIVDTSEGVQVGDIAEYECKPGFILVGCKMRTCLSGNKWSGKAPKCIEVCDGLMDPAYGDVSLSDGLKVGSIATYTCSNSYRLDGDKTRRCVEGGTWTGTKPKCVPVCSVPIAPTNGKVDYSDGLDVDDVAIYSCNDGYVMNGEAKTTCMCGNKWSYPTPMCIPVCTIPPNPANGYIVTPGAVIEVGCTITYKCNDGYVLDGKAIHTCLHGNEWSAEPPTCVPEAPKTCDPPSVPEFGSSDVNEPVEVGNYVTYCCDEGYVLVGNKKRLCEETGWTGRTPKCYPEDGSTLSSDTSSSSHDHTGISGSFSHSHSHSHSSSSSGTSSSSSSAPTYGTTAKCCVEGCVHMDLRGKGVIKGAIKGVKASVMSKSSMNCSALGYLEVDFEKYWTNQTCGGCLREPTCGRRMLIVKLHLSKYRLGWLFHVGDSKSNNGALVSSVDPDQTAIHRSKVKHGDNGDQDWDAQVNGFTPNIKVLTAKNEECVLKPKVLRNLGKALGSQANTITLYISNEHVRIMSDGGLDVTVCTRCLFNLSGKADKGTQGKNEKIFVGINRFVKDITRRGVGVCSAAISWSCPWCCA